MATEDDKKDEAAAADAEKAPSVSEGISDEAAEAKVTAKDAEPAEKAAAAPPAEEEEHLVAEPDRVNVGVIGALTLAIIISTVAVVIGVQQFTTQTFGGEVNKKLYEPEDPMKKELYAVETAKLHKYQWASQKDGIVRIPVERARELVLADYGKMAAYQPGVMPAPSVVAPEPAPAASSSAEPATSASIAPSASASAPPAPSGSVAPEGSTLKPGMAPSTSASVPHKH